jgi:two-component system response regulator FixJ
MNESLVVHVVDDEESVRDSLRWLLESVGLQVRAHADGEAFLHAYRPEESGCVLLDIRMPGLSGIEVLERMGAEGQRVPVIVFTGHADVPLAVRAMRLGAFDFIEKPYSDSLLLERVQRALAVRRETRDREQAIEETRRAFERLSPRERQVLARVLEGRPNKLIAEDLSLSIKTIEVHRANLMHKMGAGSLAELIRRVVQAGIEP